MSGGWMDSYAAKIFGLEIMKYSSLKFSNIYNFGTMVSSKEIWESYRLSKPFLF